MEGQIYIRCREEDKRIIESIIQPAIDEYRKMVVSQVKRFEGKNPNDIPCKVQIDTKFLEGSIGGFKLFAKKGRIVCS